MFLICYGQPNNVAVYVSDLRTMSGSEIVTSVHEAHQFKDMVEVCNYLTHNSSELRYMIIEVASVTWDIIQQGYRDYNAGVISDARNLFHKFNTVDYIMNSR